MKTIYMEKGVIMYYGSRAGQIADGCAVVDPLFQGPELLDFLDKQKHIREVKWMDGIYDRLMNAPKETGFQQAALKNVRIWQLKPDVDIQMKFIPFEELSHRFGPPDLSNYEAVYDGARALPVIPCPSAMSLNCMTAGTALFIMWIGEAFGR